MNNSPLPFDETVKKFVNYLEQNASTKTLALSDEDIADILWLACQIGVEKAQPEKSSISQPNAPSKQIITSIDNAHSQIQPSVNLHSPTIVSQTEEKEENTPKGLPFQTPAAPALLNKLAISRALRPLMRKVPSPIRKILDVEGTVARIAEQDIWLPVTKPELERWLDLELIIEENKSSFIWEETVAELEALLQNHGAFRRVRVWRLQNPDTRESSDSRKSPKLTRWRKKTTLNFWEHSHRELMASNGRSLIILVSDCVSSIWQQETIYHWLEKWSEKVPTAIMQLFPERFWLSTELGLGYQVKFSAFMPGVPNAKLVAWEDFDIRESLNLPIITLEAESLEDWAKVIAGYGSIQTPGIVLDLKFVKEQIKTPRKPAASSDPENIVDRFLTTASSTAQQLAGLMAAVPVSLPIVHLIQKNFLPKSTPVHIAEVFLSGMIERKGTGTAQTLFIDSKKDEKESKHYDFVPGVRKLLNRAMPLRKTEAVLDVISEYITENLGLSIKSFTALLFSQQDLSRENQEKILPFAQVALEVLRNLGGEYADFANQIESPGVSTVSEPSLELPNRRIFQFEVATIVFEDEINLQPFEFEVATLDLKQTGWFRKKTELVINRRRKQAWGYSEDLGKGVLLEMVAIPEGSFMMGSPKDESGRYGNESPQHEVTVKAFLMGKYPVTQAQWKAVAALPQVNQELSPEPSEFKGDDHRPVEQVSWLDAVEFCNRLSRHTNKPYRLPSEAEWEYACRAGTTTLFHFGETITTDLANYDGTDSEGGKWSGSYGRGPKGIYRRETTPVGSFKVANAFGLFDMHGNVWEWCADHWHDNYEGAPEDGSAWVDEGLSENDNDSQYRVLRGGSWSYDPENCRSAIRFNYDAGDRDNYLGFRVVCAAAWTL